MVNMTDEFLVALDSLVKENSKIMYSDDKFKIPCLTYITQI